MKALVLYGPGDLRLESVPKPAPKIGSVVVKVIVAPVWDYLAEVVDGSRQYPLAYPLTLGTCCIGRIDAVGAGVTLLKPGQLVFCDYLVRLRDAPEERICLGYHGGMTPNELALSASAWRDGCFAEFANFPAENIHTLDESRLQAHGIQTNQMAEIASLMPGMAAANAIGIKPGDTVLALPATGFFSSSGVAAVLALGADVIVGSRDKNSLDALVQHFGKDGKRLTPVVLTGDITKDMISLRAVTPGGNGADAYIEYSPPAAAQTTHIKAGLMALKRGGKCCFCGVIIEDVSLPYAVIMGNCLTITGQFAQTRQDVVQTVKLIETGKLKLNKEIIGPFPIESHAEMLKVAAQSKGWKKMVLFTP